MDPSLVSFPRAFSVRFKDFKRWDPASFQSIKWHWPPEQMAPIGSVLRVRRERVDRNKFPFSQLNPITIHFDGSIDRRKLDSSREYSMDLYFARPGDVVVAKIDLKNGAVGIVPEGWENVCVTSHFAVYEPDLSRIVPQYLHRLIQTSFFQQYLWRNKVGAEGRKEVKLDFFESAVIPLPSVQTQQAIMNRWRAMQDSIEVSEQNATARLAALDDHFLEALGLSASKMTQAKKYLAVPWSQFRRWGVSYNEATLRLTSLSRGRFPVAELGSLLELVQYGTSDKAHISSDGVPILRINNIKDGTIDTSYLKYIRLSKKNRGSLLLKEGDILIIRTSGSKDLVGTSAVFHEQGEFVFASYLIRLRVQAGIAIPDFVSWFLNSDIGRQQINATSRQIMQNNINSAEISSLLIPLPPLSVQSKIVHRIDKDRQKIALERERSRQLRSQVSKEVEEMILGVRPVTEVREQSQEFGR